MQLASQPTPKQPASTRATFNRTGASRARAESRATVLGAARDVLKTASFKSFSMEQVAHRAGVTRRTVYNLFVAKDDLYRASRASLLHDLSASVVDAIPSDMPLVDGLRYFLEGVHELFRDPRHQELLESIDRDGAELDWLVADYRRYIRAPIVRTCENYVLTRMWRRQREACCALMVAEQLVALVDALTANHGGNRMHALSPSSDRAQLDLIATAYGSMLATPSVRG